MNSAERTHEERTYAMRDYYLLIAHSYLYGIVSIHTLFIPFYSILPYLIISSIYHSQRVFLQV